jgi:oxygen-independent coproporphyrinogen-3 oxidase
MGLEQNLELAVDLRPSRIALFGYAHVPFFKKHQTLIPEKALPGIEERLAMLTFAEGCLTGNGYQPIGLDHFALCGDDLAIAPAPRQSAPCPRPMSRITPALSSIARLSI